VAPEIKQDSISTFQCIKNLKILSVRMYTKFSSVGDPDQHVFVPLGTLKIKMLRRLLLHLRIKLLKLVIAIY
jgi:hypothetical protein